MVKGQDRDKIDDDPTEHCNGLPECHNAAAMYKDDDDAAEAETAQPTDDDLCIVVGLGTVADGTFTAGWPDRVYYGHGVRVSYSHDERTLWLFGRSDGRWQIACGDRGESVLFSTTLVGDGDLVPWDEFHPPSDGWSSEMQDLVPPTDVEVIACPGQGPERCRPHGSSPCVVASGSASTRNVPELPAVCSSGLDRVELSPLAISLLALPFAVCLEVEHRGPRVPGGHSSAARASCAVPTCRRGGLFQHRCASRSSPGWPSPAAVAAPLTPRPPRRPRPPRPVPPTTVGAACWGPRVASSVRLRPTSVRTRWRWR